LLKVALSNITLTLKLKLENVSSIITTLAICIYINKNFVMSTFRHFYFINK
jgi:uncharacterized membrane protein AbrB (regulator of aidB expression)